MSGSPACTCQGHWTLNLGSENQLPDTEIWGLYATTRTSTLEAKAGSLWEEAAGGVRVLMRAAPLPPGPAPRAPVGSRGAPLALSDTCTVARQLGPSCNTSVRARRVFFISQLLRASPLEVAQGWHLVSIFKETPPHLHPHRHLHPQTSAQRAIPEP